MIKIIAAISKNGVIGNLNKLIWDLPNDMKRFRKLTLNNTVIMGRKTYESIGGSLPERRNIIITRNKNFKADNCIIASSLEEALRICENNCYIIGGGEIYKQSIGIADEMYLTIIDNDFEGDSYFPKIDKNWVEVDRKSFEQDDLNKYKYSFIYYEKYEL